jgi:hypothetical protein
LVAIINGNDEPDVFIVQQTEDVNFDYTFQAAIATLTIGQSEKIDIAEPKNMADPAVEMYQLRVGVDVGTIYTELLMGSYRRTPFKAKRSTTTTPYVGYFDKYLSPFIDPRVEIFLRYNEQPAFSCYNRGGYSITPKLHFQGRKLVMLPLETEIQKEVSKDMHMSVSRLMQMRNGVLENTVRHRRITAYGVAGE